MRQLSNILALMLLLASACYGANGDWGADAGGNWSDTTKWSGGVAPGTAAGDVVNLQTNITAASTITIDGGVSRTVGVLGIGDPTSSYFAYTLTNAATETLTFNNSGSGSWLLKTNPGTATDIIDVPLVLADSLTISNVNGALTIGGAISSTGGSKTLTKAGTNTLTLSGNNTYSGSTVLGGGTLQLAHTNATGASTNLAMANGTTLALRSDTSATFNTPSNAPGLGSITEGATVTIDVNNSTSGSGNSLTLGGGLRVLGTSASTTKLNVTGGNGYALSIPTLAWQCTASSPNLYLVPSNANLTVNTMTFGYVGGQVQTLYLDGTSTNNSMNTISAPTWLRVYKQGAGTWTWNPVVAVGQEMQGMNVVGGVLVINGTIRTQNQSGQAGLRISAGSTVHYNNAGALDSLAKGTEAGLIFVANGAQLDNSSGAAITTSTYNPLQQWNGDWTFLGSQGANSDLNIGNGAVTMNATRTVTINSNATLTVGGTISGAGFGLTKAGTGTLTLGGANTFSGTASASAGTLKLTHASGLGGAILNTASAGAITLVGPTTLTLGGLTGSVNLGTGNIFSTGYSGVTALTLNNQSGITTYSGVIADGSAPMSLTKTGAGTQVLTGVNTYTGPTTLQQGELVVSNANNLGTGNALIITGGTLGITNTALTSLSGIGHPVTIAPTSGGTIGMDILSAANTFTLDQAFTGAVNFVKSGPGTLVFATNNTYTGATTINGGVLQYNDGATIPTTPLFNSGALIVNRSDTLTQGATFHSIMMGTGTVTKSSSGNLVLNGPNTYSGATKVTGGTLTVSHPLALQNSPLDTTGIAGGFVLSGVTAPTFGGLSGASGDLSSIISGYGSVTALTLNPSGSVTNGGVIADGASGMTLTKSGAGTQVLQGANTYSGATYLNAGTLELSGSGSILNSAITFNGGGLKLSNTAAETGSGRISDSAAITANGGTLTYNNTSGNTYAETIGSVSLARGQLDVVEAVNMATGSQTLTLAGLTQADAAAVTFSALTTGPQASGNRNMIVVTGAGSTGAGQIIGPWATVGTAAAAQTDYAVYNSNYVVPANIAGTAQTSWTVGTQAFTQSSALETLGGTRTMTALRNTGATATTALNGNFLETYGLLNGVGTTWTISGTGAVRQQGTTATNLYVTTGSGAITISAPINDNTGALTLVKNGAGTLTLSSTTSTYSGGTVLNTGTLSIGADTNLGAANSAITFNGNATLQHTATVSIGSRPITVNSGAVGTIRPDVTSKNFTTSGALTGSGSLVVSSPTGNQVSFSLLSTGNTFTGPIYIGDGTGNVGVSLTMNSVGDSANPIILNSSLGSAGGGFIYGAGATSALTLNNRQFQLGSAATAENNDVINNASSYNLTINTDIGFSGTGGRYLNLSSAGSGTNTFNGRLTDNAGGTLSLTVGNWRFSGTNTYSGNTKLTGTLTIQGLQALSPYTPTVEVPHGGVLKLLGDGTGTVNYPNTTMYCNGNNAGTVHSIFVGNNTPANGGNNPSSPGANCTVAFNNMTFFQKSDNPTISVDVTGANGFRLQLNNVTLPVTGQAVGGAGNITFNPTTASVTLAGTIIQTNGNPFNLGAKTLVLGGTAADNLVSGTIKDAADYTDASNPNARPLSLTKSSASTWTLSGANTHTGTNNLNGGTLVFSNALALGTGSIKFTGGTLKYGTGFTTDLSSRIKSSTSAVSIDPNGQTVTFANPIDSSNSGGLTMAGLGTLTLSAANAFTGANTVQNGKLKADASNTLVFSGANALTFNTQGGTFEYDNGSAGAPRAQGLGALTFTLGDGAVQLTKTTAGQDLKLTFASLATRGAGGTGNFIWGGTTDSNNGIYFTTVNAGFQNQGEFFNGSNYAYMNAANSYVRGINYGSDGSTVSLGAGTEIGSGDASKHVRLTGAMSGQTTRTILTLNIAGAYDFTLASGTVTLSNGGILKAGGGASVISGGTAITAASNVEFVFRTDTASDVLTINTPVTATGANALTKSGPGTLILNGANTYTGNTYVNQGALRLGNAAGAGTTGAITVQNGAALELAGGISIGNKTITTTGSGISGGGALLNKSGTNTYGGALTVGSGGTRINADSGSALVLTNTITTAAGNDLTVGGAGNVTVSNVISGAGGVIKDGSGTLTLVANNTYSGPTTINTGTLAVVTGGSCSNSAVTVASSGTLQVKVTTTNAPWSCASLALNNGSQVRFTFSVTPSTTLAPLNILGNLTFSGTPVIVVDQSRVTSGQIYPLLVVRGTAPTALPTLNGVSGKLYWGGGAGNWTLYLRTYTGTALILE